jgi:predicted DNA-binding protein (UPF0251 family)
MIAAFVPEGVPVSGELFLSIEGLEAIRLSDFEHLDQTAAASLMKVSRQTYGRILSAARSTVGEALVTGKALRVEGGNYAMRGRGRRRRARDGRGPHRYSETEATACSPPSDAVTALKAEAKSLKKSLADIHARIDALDRDAPD